MVDHQLLCAARRVGPARTRQRKGPPPPRVPRQLTDAGERLVLVWCEANGHPLVEGVWNPPELVHLCAVRPETGERFERVLRPRRPLAAAIPDYIELRREQLDVGTSVDAARRDFHTFLGSGSLVAGVGELLRPPVDRRGISRGAAVRPASPLIRLERGPGAIESRVPRPGTGHGARGTSAGALALLPVFLAAPPRAAVA
jgi:hypothetical protein